MVKHQLRLNIFTARALDDTQETMKKETNS